MMTGLRMRVLAWLTMLSLVLVVFQPHVISAESDEGTQGLGMPAPGLMADDDDDWDDDDAYDDDEWDDDDYYDDDDDWDDDDYYDDDDWDDDDWDDDDDVTSVTIDLPVADQAIIELASGVDADDFADDHDVIILNRIENPNILLVNLNAAENDAEEVGELLTDDDVLWAELNYTSRVPEGDPRYFFTNAALEPRMVDAPALPAGMSFDPAQMCTTGSSVVVAVLDTGVDASHPAIEQNLVSEGVSFVTGDTSVNDIGDQIDNDQDGYVDEMVGHGTHVTGTVLLVAPNAGILPVKVLNSDGVGDSFSVMAGIYYAVQNDADVINLSLGTTHDSLAIRQAVAYAQSEGVVVVAAAGNDNQWQYEQFPASLDGVISVASHNDTGDKSDFSNYNQNVDVSAPGENVASAYPGGLYTTGSGTSMASPIVAGTVAHVLEYQPDSTVQQVTETLQSSSVPLTLSDPSLEPFLGSGRLSVPENLMCP